MKAISAVGVLFVAAALTGGAVPQQKPLVVPLKWTPIPKENLRPPTIDITGGLLTVRFEPVADKREQGRQIGENTEGKTPVPIVTDSNVATFLDQCITGQMRALGLSVVKDKPERVVALELIDLWASESSGYRCTIRLKVQVRTADGQEIWTGLVGGTGENYGRSLRVANYQETISNAILDWVYALAREPKFNLALKK
jgi:hypothetical protein